MKKTKKYTARAGGVVVLLMCGAVSLFLLASGYESVYSRSLPLVHTIEEVSLHAFADTYDLDATAVHDEADYGNFGRPQTVKFPGRTVRWDIVEPLHDGSSWLARANTFHLLLPEKPRNGNMGVALLYCRASFRTLNEQLLPKNDSNIFIDTDRSWRYVYKVTSTTITPSGQPYVVADSGVSPKLVIGCYDNQHDTMLFVEANFLSVQGIDS